MKSVHMPELTESQIEQLETYCYNNYPQYEDADWTYAGITEDKTKIIMVDPFATINWGIVVYVPVSEIFGIDLSELK